MTTISAKSDVMTLINVFTVEPANQRRLVELLTEATEVSVRRAPGFVSASLHRSTDGTKVTMYAQWRSIDDYQAMRQDPAPLPFLQEALTIAKLNPASTKSCEPSHPPASRIEATTVLSALRHKPSVPRGAFAQAEVAAEPIYSPITRECEEHGWMQDRADPHARDRARRRPPTLLQTRPSPKFATPSTRSATPARSVRPTSDDRERVVR